MLVGRGHQHFEIIDICHFLVNLGPKENCFKYDEIWYSLVQFN